jgi:hypothetical protein
MHLDALCLKTDLSVVEAKVDFSRLPYWDGTREINHDVANISSPGPAISITRFTTISPILMEKENGMGRRGIHSID